MNRIRHFLYHILRQGEKYTKTDNIYLAKGGFWLTFGQFISAATGFSLAVAFANLLPPAIYGTYQFVLASANILSATTLSGLNTAAIRSVAKGAEGVILEALKTKVRWGLTGSLISVGIASYYLFQSNIILSVSFLIVALFLPFFYSFGISNSLLKGKKLFGYDVRYGTLSQVIAAIAVITTLLVTNNIFAILIVYFGTWTLMRFLIFKITLGKFQKNDISDPLAKSYGKHLSAMGIISTIADYLDKLLIFHFLGAIEVAIYSFAIAPVMQLKGLLKNINILALPKMAQRTREELRDSIIKRNFIALALSIPLVVVYVLAAPYIYRIFFPEYLKSVFFSQVFALVILFTAFGTLSGSTLEAQAEVKRKYILTSSSKIAKAVFMLLLVIPYGIWGVILGILLANFFTSLLALWLAWKP